MTDKAVYSNGTISNFKEKLPLGCTASDGNTSLFNAEKFELRADDVLKNVKDGNPSIKFSKQVHSYINESMTNTVDLKLFGRKIGFNALMNQAIALCMRSHLFRLMDFENNYFLTRFRTKRDCLKVSVDGP
ncbi:hypothetical protein J1N35_004738 [Gossypium stocksii]|uniref:Uncharacterized protein n=1 Tax=Gossypium stocksii TaxID=47602 RepID=A0A9D4AIB5_9ROSI|nr:hypothetical protein J1N35_004738 [Gossypium stocksii]